MTSNSLINDASSSSGESVDDRSGIYVHLNTLRYDDDNRTVNSTHGNMLVRIELLSVH
jgi:hypothetical protein